MEALFSYFFEVGLRISPESPSGTEKLAFDSRLCVLTEQSSLFRSCLYEQYRRVHVFFMNCPALSGILPLLVGSLFSWLTPEVHMSPCDLCSYVHLYDDSPLRSFSTSSLEGTCSPSQNMDVDSRGFEICSQKSPHLFVKSRSLADAEGGFIYLLPRFRYSFFSVSHRRQTTHRHCQRPTHQTYFEPSSSLTQLSRIPSVFYPSIEVYHYRKPLSLLIVRFQVYASYLTLF